MNCPVFLTPHFTHNIWGGTRLKEIFGYEVSGEDIGECWGVSAHPHGESVVRDGPYKGIRLSELWYGERQLFAQAGTRFRRASDPFPLMLKLIDAREDLSIQVHPDDDYARIHENGSLGKCECWYVVDAPAEGSLVIGHNAKTKKSLAEMIDNGKWEKFIREVPARKGDVIPILPGTVHAIRAGYLLFEAQQNSDLTYRVYDYDRVRDGVKRDLHLQRAKDVISVPGTDAGAWHPADGEAGRRQFLSDCGYFTMERLVVEKEARLKNLTDVFATVCVLEGEGRIVGEKTQKITKGDFFIVPVHCGALQLKGDMTLMIVQPG